MHTPSAYTTNQTPHTGSQVLMDVSQKAGSLNDDKMITLRMSASVWQHSNIFLISAGIVNQRFGGFRNMKSIEGHKIFYSIFSFPISIFGKYFKGFQTFETRFLWCIQWQQSEKKLIMKVSSCKFQIKQKWYNSTLTS